MVLALSSLASKCLATVSAARRFSPARLSNAATSPAQSLSASAPASLSADNNELDIAAEVKCSESAPSSLSDDNNELDIVVEVECLESGSA
jgi:hypothetical protein